MLHQETSLRDDVFGFCWLTKVAQMQFQLLKKKTIRGDRGRAWTALKIFALPTTFFLQKTIRVSNFQAFMSSLANVYTVFFRSLQESKNKQHPNSLNMFIGL